MYTAHVCRLGRQYELVWFDINMSLVVKGAQHQFFPLKIYTKTESTKTQTEKKIQHACMWSPKNFNLTKFS